MRKGTTKMTETEKEGYYNLIALSETKSKNEPLDKEDYKKLLRLAGNPKAPRDMLEKLSNSWVFKFRKAVAKNTHAGNKVLEKLSFDKVFDVRIAVAENATTPFEVLERMLNETTSDLMCLTITHNAAYMEHCSQEIK